MPLPLTTYNTLGRRKELLSPVKEGFLSIYHCGPTVYWTQHIGNLRAAVIGDFIRRSGEFLGYETVYVRNITDVGHLSGDNTGNCDEGVDRMEKAAKREDLQPLEIAAKYTKTFHHDLELLNNLPPTHEPKATEHIKEMQNLVLTLLEKDFAYLTPLAVYFDISKVDDYAALSGQDMSKLISNSGHGDIVDGEKKNAGDFALWFFKAGSHSKALQTWDSPFDSPLVKNGEGFPGWHIECSAMGEKYLGENFDIHIGGVEHISIHHTNERAQSLAAHDGVPMCNAWLHNEHLMIDGGKMSKSEGTSVTLDDIIEKGYEPQVLRYFFLQAHYRSKQNFTWEALEASNKALTRLKKTYENLPQEGGSPLQTFSENFANVLADDFNTPEALAIVHKLTKSEESPADIRATLDEMNGVLGLNLAQDISDKTSEKIPQEITLLANERLEAKSQKDWGRADELRDEILGLGYKIKDTAEGFELLKK